MVGGGRDGDLGALGSGLEDAAECFGWRAAPLVCFHQQQLAAALRHFVEIKFDGHGMFNNSFKITIRETLSTKTLAFFSRNMKILS